MGDKTNYQAGGQDKTIFSQFALLQKDLNYQAGIEM